MEDSGPTVTSGWSQTFLNYSSAVDYKSAWTTPWDTRVLCGLDLFI